MVERLSVLGVEYGRFVDDMNCSVRRLIEPAVRTGIVQEIRGTIEKAGLKPKRSKQLIVGAGSQMQVHKLNVNTRASRTRDYRQKLRSDMHHLKLALDAGTLPVGFETQLRSLATRIGGLTALNPEVAKRYKNGLRAIKLRCRQIAGVPRISHATKNPGTPGFIEAPMESSEAASTTLPWD
jgi:hypothetical protein